MTKAKYSPTMLRALRALHAPSELDAEGVKRSYWINTNTAVALRARGALVNITGSRYGITREGAEAVGIDYDATIERAHEQALIDNVNFRRCPLADVGCDFVTFGRPATPFGHHREITSDDQVAYHVNQAHIPMGEALFIPSITQLTDEHRANVAQFVEAYRQAKAYDARTGVGTGTSEARCRQAKRNHTLVYVEGAEGRIDDVAVLAGVKFHVTGVNLDGWYYPNQLTIYDGRVRDVEAAREAAHAEYFDWTGQHPVGRIMSFRDLEEMDHNQALGQRDYWYESGSISDIRRRIDADVAAVWDQAHAEHAALLAITKYAVNVPVDVEHCAAVDAHEPHAWSWLGPQVSHFCDGSVVDAAIPVADDEQPTTTWAQYHENHPEVAASWGEQNGRPVNCGCPKCDPDGLQPRPDIFVDLPQLRGPVTDGRGHDIAEEADEHLRHTLGDSWPGVFGGFVSVLADGNLGFTTAEEVEA
jgi:hypothetical protein